MTPTAITATGVRQTQILTAPPTQNTAPVLEYRCLFTSDLRRKQKRWQDGFLRFHTFNKRIMVYENPSRNYIGDQHWREDEVLQDGDELQLDRPVLVQVGEVIGKSETDLTELLDKRRRPKDIPLVEAADQPQLEQRSTYAASTPATAQQAVRQTSQLRPKTLNALLGTPKGPIGRASIPTKSPHQIRYGYENENSVDDRASKRRRTDNQENARPMQLPASNQKSVHSMDPAIANKPTIESSIVIPKDKVVLREPNGVVDSRPTGKPENGTPRFDRRRGPEKSDSLQQSPLQDISSTTLLQTADQRDVISMSRNAKSVTKCTSKPIKDCAVEHFNDSTLDKFPKSASSHVQRFVPPGLLVEKASEKDNGDTHQESHSGKPKEKTKLQIAARKPRKKLMYRDLLPERLPPDKRSPSIGQLNGHGHPSKRSKHDMTDDHDEEQGRLADRLNRCKSSVEGPFIPSRQESEPLSLFVSQEDWFPSPTNHHRTKEKMRSPPKPTSSHQDINDSSPQIKQAHLPSHKQQTIPRARSTVHDTALTLAKMDEILFPQKQLPVPSKSPNLKPYIQEISSRESSPSPSPPNLGDKSPRHSPHKPPPRALTPSMEGIYVPSNMEPATTATNSSPPLESSASCPQHTNTEAPVTSADTRAAQNRSPSSPQQPEGVTLRKPSPTMTRKRSPQNKSGAISSIFHPSVDPDPTQDTPQNLSSLDQTPPQPSPNPPLQNQPFSVPRMPTSDPFTLDTSSNNLTIAQKSLPAFQAPRPKSRSPLKKSVSDSSAMAPPSAFTAGHNVDDATSQGMGDDGRCVASGGGVEAGIRGAEQGKGRKLRDTKEAWDLFGCGSDGVQCSYREFKRKYGIA